MARPPRAHRHRHRVPGVRAAGAGDPHRGAPGLRGAGGHAPPPAARVSASLLRRLARLQALAGPAGRLALADVLLAVITAGMLVSGFWDWFAGHPTKIRWHAITGVVLAILLLVHTVRRWSRLRRSKVR